MKKQHNMVLTSDPFRLPGQYYDSETGLHYNYFRYYDPTAGRYVTPDPIGLEGGINLFTYVDSVGKPFDMSLYTYTANNPVNLTDPKGLLVAPWHFVITYEAALNSVIGDGSQIYQW